MKQYFTLDETNSFHRARDGGGLRLEGANWISPVVVDSAGGVDWGAANDNRALCVPFDNDHFVRYDAQSINSSSVSYEVGAFYDNTTRNGLVAGSVEHDTWKSGVVFLRLEQQAQPDERLRRRTLSVGCFAAWQPSPAISSARRQCLSASTTTGAWRWKPTPQPT